MRTNSSSLALGLIAFMVFAPGAFGQNDADTCAAEAVWINCWEGLGVSAGSGATATLHLRSHVSQGSCLPARVALTAAYMDRYGEVLCVGTQEEIARLDGNVQNVVIEINPLFLGNFSRWMNRPNQRMDPMFEALKCAAPNGRTNLLDNQVERAVTVEVAATLLPSGGGLAVAECRIGLNR
jgi:hypothetical protein